MRRRLTMCRSGATLLLALLLGASAAAAKPRRFLWPAMDAIEEVRVSEIVQADGTPVAMKILRVRERPKDLLQRYATAFEKGGLYLMPGKDQPQVSKVPMLTALDPVRRITYSVFFQANKDGTTTLILGEANFALRSKTRPGDFAPLVPGAENVLRTEQESGQVLSFRVKATEAEVQTFYRDMLPKDRWVEGTLEGSSEGTWRRGNEELQLFQEAAEGGARAVVLMRRRLAP